MSVFRGYKGTFNDGNIDTFVYITQPLQNWRDESIHTPRLLENYLRRFLRGFGLAATAETCPPLRAITL